MADKSYKVSIELFIISAEEDDEKLEIEIIKKFRQRLKDGEFDNDGIDIAPEE